MKFLKKIAPLAVGLLFFGATAAAAGLDTWTTDFAGADIVVHAGLATSAYDVLAAVNIGNALGISTTIIPAGHEIGESIYIKQAGDVLGYGNDLDTMAPTGLTEDELPTILAEEKFTETKGDNSNKVNFDQTLEFDPDNAATLTLALDIDDETVEEPAGTYIYFDKGDNIYQYLLEFDEDVEFTNADGDEDFDNVKLIVQGKTYTITDVTEDGDALLAIEMMGGAVSTTQAEYTTETYVLDDVSYEVEVLIISDDDISVKLKVNDETTDALVAGDTYELVDGTEIGVEEVLPNEGSEEAGADLVSFYLGAQKIELTDGGEVEINGDTIEDYTTAVVFDDDEGATGVIRSITITLEPDDDIWMGLDSEWIDPVFGNWKLSFNELEKTTELMTLDVTGGDDGDFEFINNDGDTITIPLVLDAATDDVAFGEDDKYIDGDATNGEGGDGLGIVDGNAENYGLAWRDLDVCYADDLALMEEECDGFLFTVISVAGEARLYSIDNIVGDTGGGGCGAGECTFDIKDEQTGKVIVEDASCDSADTVAIAGMGTLQFDCETAVAIFEFEDIDLAGDGHMDTSLGGYIELAYNANEAHFIVGDGGVPSEDTHVIDDDANDDMIFEPDANLDWMDLEEDSDTEIALDQANWGIIYTNKDATDDNHVTIEYPEEIDDDTGVAAKVYITEILSTGTSEGATVTGLSYDTETSFDGPVVSVGGTGINQVTATLLGLTYPTYGYEQAWIDATGVDSAGKGIIKIIESPALGTVAMIVAGWEGVETQVLGDILKEGTPALTGTEVLIDTSGKTVITV